MDEPPIFVKKDEFFHPLLALFPRFSPLNAAFWHVYLLLHFVATRIGNKGKPALRFSCGRDAFRYQQIRSTTKTRYDMNLKAKLIVSALGVCALPLAQAQAGDFEDFGRVVRVQPRIEQVRTPRQECRTDYVQAQVPQQRSQAGTVIGGIAGALLGSQVGGGNGKVAAAAAGAIAGGMIGDNVDNNGRAYGPQVQEQAVQRCRTVDSIQERTNGYDVTYDYRGHTYQTVMNRDPGNRVRLRVSVEPDQYQ
jgi:uncharacterized protein YcfJ